MSLSITADIEDALIAKIKTAFGATLKKVETHPGQWSDSVVKRMIQTTPSVYIAWLGWNPDRIYSQVKSTWGVFVVAQVLNGRRRDQPGIYQIAERLTALIDGRPFARSDAFTLRSAGNLWSDMQATAGVAVYGLYFDAGQPLPDDLDTEEQSDINPFETYYQHFNQTGDAPPDMEALATLEQDTQP